MNAKTVTQLAEFRTTTVATAINKMLLRDPASGFTGPDTRVLMPDLGTRVGIAITARLDTTTGGHDTPENEFAQWLDAGRELANSFSGGTVPLFAVIESAGQRPRNTVIGPMIAAQMKLVGVEALLTDGCVRDLDGLRSIRMACWAAGLAPMHGTIRWLEFNMPVVVDGMTVRPGDLVHADVNGAVVMPAEVADKVYEQALVVKERDRSFYAKLAQTGSL